MREDAFSCETRTDPAVANHCFPPAVLLPLLQAVTTTSLAVARQAHLSLIAFSSPACVRIELTCHAASPPPPGEALDAALSALRKFFGEQVSVVATRAPFTGQRIQIEVPHATA